MGLSLKNKVVLPHDHPSQRRHDRLYFALTNHCNRSCPWCSVFSSPEKSSFLSIEKFKSLLPQDAPFEVQLEGGEPTVHPHFLDFVKVVREQPQCSLLVICTNAVLFPREKNRLEAYLEKLGKPLLLKISVNHHLLERDPGLLELLQKIHQWAEHNNDCDLVINVRRRKNSKDEDRTITEKLKALDLLKISNDFYLQRYGLAKNEMSWDLPFAVKDQFLMVNPDGEIFDGDLIKRSEAMGALK